MPRRSFFGSSLLANGILCVLFGMLILANPDLIAYIVALFFIIAGATLILMWWRLRR